jgi:hypothetical protein
MAAIFWKKRTLAILGAPTACGGGGWADWGRGRCSTNLCESRMAAGKAGGRAIDERMPGADFAARLNAIAADPLGRPQPEGLVGKEAQ